MGMMYVGAHEYVHLWKPKDDFVESVLFNFAWILRVKIKSLVLCSKHLYPLSQVTSPSPESFVCIIVVFILVCFRITKEICADFNIEDNKNFIKKINKAYILISFKFG